MSESPGKSDVDLAIESFVDRLKDIHPDLDQEEFYNAISGYVHQAVSEAEEDEES